jgi:hypothetical protein
VFRYYYTCYPNYPGSPDYFDHCPNPDYSNYLSSTCHNYRQTAYFNNDYRGETHYFETGPISHPIIKPFLAAYRRDKEVEKDRRPG